MGEQVAAKLYGGVAQLGEHLPCKQGVKSSNLSISICTRTRHIKRVHRISCIMYLENFTQNNDEMANQQEKAINKTSNRENIFFYKLRNKQKQAVYNAI